MKFFKKLKELIPTIDKLRHVVKSISYRFYSTCITITIASFVTGSTKTAFAIGSADFFIKIFTYYIHERIWFYIPFGLQKPRKIHAHIEWEPSIENGAHVQIEFIEFEDKDSRKRVKVTKSLVPNTGSHGETEYRALLSTKDKNTNKRLSAIFMGTKQQIEDKLNIKLKDENGK
jgi:uncharacterized membrane protein